MERRKYVKPEVLIEDFILSQCIASCSYNIKTQENYGCLEEYFGPDDIAISNGGFAEKFDCGISVDSGVFDGYCYHTLEGKNIMAS